MGRPVGRCAATPATVASGGSAISKVRGLHWVRGRRAGVVDEVALGDVKLAVVAFELEDVGFDEDAFDLGGHVVDGNVAGAAALGCGDEVARALVGDANEIGTAAGLIERVAPLASVVAWAISLMPACTSTRTMGSPAAGLPVVLSVTVPVTVAAWARAAARKRVAAGDES